MRTADTTIGALESLALIAPTDELKIEIAQLSDLLGNPERTESSPRKFKVLFWALHAASTKTIDLHSLETLLMSYQSVSPNLLKEALTVGSSSADRDKTENQYGALQFALHLQSLEVITCVLRHYEKVSVEQTLTRIEDTSTPKSSDLDQTAASIEEIVTTTPTSPNELAIYFSAMHKQERPKTPITRTATTVETTEVTTLAKIAISRNHFQLITKSIEQGETGIVLALFQHIPNPDVVLRQHGETFLKSAALKVNQEMLSALIALYLEHTDMATLQKALADTQINIGNIVTVHTEQLQRTKLQQEQDALFKRFTEQAQQNKLLTSEKEKANTIRKTLCTNQHWFLLSAINIDNTAAVKKLIEEYKKLDDDTLTLGLQQNNFEALKLALKSKNIDLLYTVIAAYYYAEFHLKNVCFVNVALSTLTTSQLSTLFDSDTWLQKSRTAKTDTLQKIYLALLVALTINDSNRCVINNALCANQHGILKYAIDSQAENLDALLSQYRELMKNEAVAVQIVETLSANDYATTKSLLDLANESSDAIKDKLRSFITEVIGNATLAALEKRNQATSIYTTALGLFKACRAPIAVAATAVAAQIAYSTFS